MKEAWPALPREGALLMLERRAGEARWRAANHPDCPGALADVLTRAMAAQPGDRPASPEAFRLQLLEAAGCAPASPERVGNVVLGLAPELVRAALTELKAQPEFLPSSWANGGLAVLEDSLLESLVSVDRLPLSRASAPPRPLSRVNLAPPGPAVAPRVNLVAPQRARPSWCQSLWPFRRT